MDKMTKSLKNISLLSLLCIISNLSFAENIYNSNIKYRLQDSDLDGVIDGRDICKATEKDSAVDNYGCPNTLTRLLTVELNILFDTNKSEIKPRFYSELTQVASFLKKHSESSVLIEGHTDNIGPEQLNLKLSESRAKAIAEILINTFKIDSRRVKGIGYGETQPIANNETEEGRELNRRVVAEVIKGAHAQEILEKKRWTIYSIDQNTQPTLHSKSD